MAWDHLTLPPKWYVEMENAKREVQMVLRDQMLRHDARYRRRQQIDAIVRECVRRQWHPTWWERLQDWWRS